MPIPLPEPIRFRCAALINLGGMMNIFSINMYMHVLDVKNRLMMNELMLQDLQDFQRLCAAIEESGYVNDFLREDVKELSDILDLFIVASYSPIRSCGMWS